MHRKSWLLTHGLSGGFITFEMVNSDERLACVEECHYTHDNAIVYTYLHFKKQVSRDAISAFVDKLKTEKNIIMFEIFGYTAIATSSPDTDLTDHVGFKVLLKHYQTNNPSFKPCTDGVHGVKKGLLWKSDIHSRLKHFAINRGKRMGQYFEELEKELADSRQLSERLEIMQEQLQEYETAIKTYKDKNKRLKYVIHAVKYRMRLLSKEDRIMLREPDHQGRPFQELFEEQE